MSTDKPPLTKAEQAAQKLDAEITRHEDFDHNRSILSKAVDYFYDKDAETLSSLKRLQSEVQDARKSGSADTLNHLDKQMETATDADRNALNQKETVTQISTSLVKSAFLFMPVLGKARSAAMATFGIAGTAATWGLDQAKTGDSTSHQLEDFGLGAIKGVATQHLMSALSAKTGDPIIAGTVMGASNRFLDNALNRNTWSSGIGSGLATTMSNSFNPDALKADAALGGVAIALHKSIGNFVAIEGNPIASNVSMGASFGLTSGLQSELQRQDSTGEKRSWSSALEAGLLQAGVNGIAAIPGGFAGRTKPRINLERAAATDTPTEFSAPLQTQAAELAHEPLPLELKAVPVQVEIPTTMDVPPIHLDKASIGLPVSDFLRSVKPEDAGEHNVHDYARAMEGYPEKAVSINHAGGDSLGLNLANGDLLKITTRTLPEEVRPFDMPVKDSGSKQVDHVTVNYFVQPKGEPTVTDEQYADFVRDVARQGYWFSDIGARNTVNYPAENRVVLVDPFAVEKIPARAASASTTSTDGGILREVPSASPLEQSQMKPGVDGNINPAEVAKSESEDAQKPFNAFSLSDEPAGRLASNFADTPFTFNNRRYKSFESFYQSLKFNDSKTRSEVAKLPGKQAKAVGSKSHATETTFNGQTFELGSPEHHKLLQEALLEKFKQNPEAAKALVETMPRPIIHDTGHAENSSTFLPADEFTRMLTEIREQLSKVNLSGTGKRK
jgi:predicted NAD-dependent protein-ADP-ribosyltransferase YbiA (DUF1768 family)